MWSPEGPTRNALALAMAAAVAFFGGAMLLKAGRIFPQLSGGGTAAGRPGMLLLSVVILLGLAGVLLVAMAVKELLELRHQTHVR